MQTVVPALALLHGEEVHFSWTQWDAHWSIVIGCAALLGLYFWGIGPARAKYALGEPASRWQITSFVSAVVILFLSLTGPLHDLSDYFLFSAHMVQHLIITLIVPPLWLMGLPDWLVRPVLRVRAVNAVARTLTNPLVAFAVYNIVFIGWHFPAFYDWALQVHAAHILQHTMFIAAAAIMWYPVVHPLPELARMQPPVRMLYLFAFSIPMSIVSAIISLSPEAMYPWYVASPRLWNISALDDQQLGGLIMWVPGMIVFWLAITVVFFRWSNREDREEAHNRDLMAGPAA